MNRTEIAEAVAVKCDISKTKAYEVVAATFDVISDHMVRSDESIQVKDFGIFKIQNAPERNGRNPMTNEAIVIPARKKVKFSMSKALNGRIN